MYVIRPQFFIPLITLIRSTSLNALEYKKELQIIQKEFPVLSRREVLLCGLLLNDIDFNDIAKLTNRSLNSVFVTVHRINKKTNIPNKNELSRVLKEIVAKARLE